MDISDIERKITEIEAKVDASNADNAKRFSDLADGVRDLSNIVDAITRKIEAMGDNSQVDVGALKFIADKYFSNDVIAYHRSIADHP